MCEISGSRCLVVAWQQAVCPNCSPPCREGQRAGEGEKGGEGSGGNIPAAEAAEAAVGEAAVAEASEAAVWESGSGRGSEGNIPEVHGRVKRSGEMSRLSSQAKRRSSGQSKVPQDRLEVLARVAAQSAGGLFITVQTASELLEGWWTDNVDILMVVALQLQNCAHDLLASSPLGVDDPEI